MHIANNSQCGLYTLEVRRRYSRFFVILSEDLYSILTNEQSFEILIFNVYDCINNLEKELTPEERLQLEEYDLQQYKI